MVDVTKQRTVRICYFSVLQTVRRPKSWFGLKSNLDRSGTERTKADIPGRTKKWINALQLPPNGIFNSY
jgi:hypothetical protein